MTPQEELAALRHLIEKQHSFFAARRKPFLSYLRTLIESLFLLQNIKTQVPWKGSSLNCMLTMETSPEICLRKSVAPHAFQQVEWLLQGLKIEQEKAHHPVKRTLENS